MNNDTRKYIAESLRLIAIGQLAAFAYGALQSDPTDWLTIMNSAAVAVVLLFAGVLIKETVEEESQ